MFVYQVRLLLLPWLLLALKLANAQSPQSAAGDVSVLCTQAISNYCFAPCLLQNGIYFQPAAAPSANPQNSVTVYSPQPCVLVQGQPSPCPQQPVPCAPISPCPNQPITSYPQPPPNPNNLLPCQPAPCPNQPVTPYPPVPSQPAPYPNQPVTPYPPVPSQPAPCPNQPVTPYPPVPSQPAPCPNQPVTPYPPVPSQPAPCPNQPVTPYPPVPSQPAPCPNQPVTLYPPVPSQPAPCPNQPVTPYPPVPSQPAPCPNQPVTPYPPVPSQPAPCPNQPVTPYPPVPSQPAPCPSQPVTLCPPVQPQPCNPIEPVTTPRPTQPPTEPPTQPTTQPTTTTTIEPSTTPAPAQIRRCPNGTVLINGNCRLVYCRSRIFENGRCVETRCPHGTYWTGQKCARPDPIELPPIHLNRTIINRKLEKKPDLVINNVHNLVVNASITLPTDYRDYEEEEVEEPVVKAPHPPKCCTVIGPRICRCSVESIRWQCYNKKQRICGNFCSAPKMALKPPTVNTWNDANDEMLVMPPDFNSRCQERGNCTQAAERYDCSGCASGQLVSCSPYCYNYRCNSPNCAFYDQEQFCGLQQFAGFVGCRWEDGWRR